MSSGWQAMFDQCRPDLTGIPAPFKNMLGAMLDDDPGVRPSAQLVVELLSSYESSATGMPDSQCADH